jgi:hypothetical protein
MIAERFKLIKTITKDTWNHIQNGNIKLECFEKVPNLNKTIPVGYIDYRLYSGQINSFYIHNAYQMNGIGTDLLLYTIEDLRKINTPEIFAISTLNHPFWSNVLDRSFTYRTRQHLNKTSPLVQVMDNNYYLKL